MNMSVFNVQSVTNIPY